MAAGRQPRAATEEKRRRLLDATEDIMLREGYAAVSSRRVAAAVGIQAPLVHYYFATIDELFVAVLRRRAGRSVERMSEALVSPRPLQAWWELASEPRGAALFVELLAAANHRPALKAEVGAIAREIRRVQVAALETLLDEYRLDADEFPPVLVAAAMQGLAFAVVQDANAGYETAPEEAAAAMERLIDRLETRRARRRRRPVAVDRTRVRWCVAGYGHGMSANTPNPNPEKDTSEWVTGDEPMTGPRRSYLHTLAQEAGETVADELTKAEASDEIERLQQQTGRGAS